MWALLALLCTTLAVGLAAETFHENCVIGAGPAGLQLAYYLKDSSRDYVVLEKNGDVGSFFTKFPRHGKLISINKRSTGSQNPFFNERHDWNSLLSDAPFAMRDFSQEYFPSSDELLKYLRRFQDHHKLNVKFNTEIKSVEHDSNDGTFWLKDKIGEKFHCRSVFVATGWTEGIRTHGQGHDMIEWYDDFPMKTENYTGQRVLIIGSGNSAMEVAKDLYAKAAYVTLTTRDRLKFSWDTHYVGDIRGVNNEVLDAYQLKSLDGFFHNFHLEDVEFSRKAGRILVSTQKFDVDRYGNSPVRNGFDRVIGCLGFKWNGDGLFGNGSNVHVEKNMGKYPVIGHDFESPKYPNLHFIGTLAHSLDYRTSAGGFIHGFRYTVRALHRLLEWRHHQVKWPHTGPLPLSQLSNWLLRRANEAAGPYQMYNFLGDVAVYDKKTQTFKYYEEFPLNLLKDFSKHTGAEFTPGKQILFTFSLDYGKNFSQPGADHFHGRYGGTTNSPEKSEFLHPVYRVYADLREDPNARQHLHPKDYDRPFSQLKVDGILHLLEDFTTQFHSYTLHIRRLERWLSFHTQEELMERCPMSCGMAYLTTATYEQSEDPMMMPHSRLPLACRNIAMVEPSVHDV